MKWINKERNEGQKQAYGREQQLWEWKKLIEHAFACMSKCMCKNKNDKQAKNIDVTEHRKERKADPMWAKKNLSNSELIF